MVSVVLPVRNRARLLHDCIASVLRQGVSLELFVVDDASTDGSGGVAAAFDDDRITVVTLPHPAGAAAARNVALRRARGSFVAFIDSDTQWPAGRLELHATTLALAPPDVAVVYGDSWLIRDGSVVQRVPGSQDVLRDGDLTPVLARYNIVDLPASLIRMEAMREAGFFDPLLPRYQDWDLFLTISRFARFRYIPGVAVIGFDGNDRISRNESAQYVALHTILRRHAAVFRRSPRERFAYTLRLLARAAGAQRWWAAVRATTWFVRNPQLLSVVVEQLRGRSPVRRLG